MNAEMRRVLGLDDPGGPWYLFWSGIGGDLPMLGILVVAYHRFNCHRQGCWRIQWRWHGDEHLCRRHHREATCRP